MKIKSKAGVRTIILDATEVRTLKNASAILNEIGGLTIDEADRTSANGAAATALAFSDSLAAPVKTEEPAPPTNSETNETVSFTDELNKGTKKTKAKK